MAKNVRFLKESQREFQKLFSVLCNTRSSWQVWADFIKMSAIAISNACDQFGETHERREKEYLRIINSYSERERETFPKMFGVTVNAMEKEPDQDFLGELFMALELSNQWRGQFFTPYNICKCMAEMEIGKCDEQINDKSYITINDPACGAGALLIAVRNALGVRKIDWSTRALFVA